jgi:hypothetical protein
MKKVGDIKPGEKVIYKSGYDVVEATVVEKPIDDNPRPKFLIGRVDLDNGFYLTRGSFIYDSVEECKQTIIESLRQEIVTTEEMIKVSTRRLDSMKKKLEELEDK